VRVGSSTRKGALELVPGDTSGTVGGGAGLSIVLDRSAAPANGSGERHFTQNFHPGWAASPQAGQRNEATSVSAPPHASQNLRLSGKLRVHR